MPLKNHYVTKFALLWPGGTLRAALSTAVSLTVVCTARIVTNSQSGGDPFHSVSTLLFWFLTCTKHGHVSEWDVFILERLCVTWIRTILTNGRIHLLQVPFILRPALSLFYVELNIMLECQNLDILVDVFYQNVPPHKSGTKVVWGISDLYLFQKVKKLKLNKPFWSQKCFKGW